MSVASRPAFVDELFIVEDPSGSTLPADFPLIEFCLVEHPAAPAAETPFDTAAVAAADDEGSTVVDTAPFVIDGDVPGFDEDDSNEERPPPKENRCRRLAADEGCDVLLLLLIDVDDVSAACLLFDCCGGGGCSSSLTTTLMLLLMFRLTYGGGDRTPPFGTAAAAGAAATTFQTSSDSFADNDDVAADVPHPLWIRSF